MIKIHTLPDHKKKKGNWGRKQNDNSSEILLNLPFPNQYIFYYPSYLGYAPFFEIKLFLLSFEWITPWFHLWIAFVRILRAFIAWIIGIIISTSLISSTRTSSATPMFYLLSSILSSPLATYWFDLPFNFFNKLLVLCDHQLQ